MRAVIKMLRDRFREPSLMVLLFVQLGLIFGIAPLLSSGIDIPVRILIALFLGVIFIVVVSSPGLWPAILAVVALLLSAAAIIARQTNETDLTDWVGAGGGFLAVATLNWVVAKSVFAPGRINEYRIIGAIVLYLNFIAIFAILFRLIAERVPGSFSGMPAHFTPTTSVGDLIYFSATTITTAGYGDITPVNPWARSLSNLEAITGQLYPAIILARVITLYTPKRGAKK